MQNERAEFLSRVIEQVKEIPVNEIIGSEIELYPKGKYYLGLCPFHPDNHLGSFVVTPSLQLWKCFACGEAGNGISFVMKYYDIDFLKAVLKLALEYNIITQAEYEAHMRKKYDGELIKRVEKEALKEKKAEREPLPPVEELHMVYQSMADICQLSDEHRKHLLEERKLSEDKLDDYFSFPTRKFALARRIQAQIKAKTGSFYWNLEKIPGFYFNKDKDEVDFMSVKGIGFLVKDDKGMARGIQIRKDTVKKGESRYVWFSSAFATDSENCYGGNPSGAPGGVIYGSRGDKGALCITEGRFKAEAIAAQGNTAIYVSGVSTWKNILPLVDATAHNRKKVFLMFDSDMLGNVAVHTQLQNMATELSKRNLTLIVCLWKKKLGKGIDDIINNVGSENIAKCCIYKAFDEFEKTYSETLEEVLKMFEASNAKDIKKEKIDEFTSILQEKQEDAFKLADFK